MAKYGRLSKYIDWIDLSFMERERTPDWAIHVGIRCYLGGMSMRDASQFSERWKSNGVMLAIHHLVHKAHLQPVSTESTDQLGVDEKVTCINGDGYWLYGAVDPQTNEFLHLRLFPNHKKTSRRDVSRRPASTIPVRGDRIPRR
jgi:transposase-like protein